MYLWGTTSGTCEDVPVRSSVCLPEAGVDQEGSGTASGWSPSRAVSMSPLPSAVGGTQAVEQCRQDIILAGDHSENK